MTASSIAGITLAEPDNVRMATAHFMLHERLQALEQLQTQAYFKPRNDNQGPYHIRLSLQNGYLVLDLQDNLTQPLQTLALSLRPYHRIIQDYFLMIRSYEQARLSAGPEKLEAIDMGRRGIHNEGAQMFLDRLADKIEMDFETARKFFTLICVLNRTDLGLMG